MCGTEKHYKQYKLEAIRLLNINVGRADNDDSREDYVRELAFETLNSQALIYWDAAAESSILFAVT